MRAGCWAAELGDCAGKLSAEHVVSAALWSGPTIRVEGGPWPEAREIGIANLTAKVLCRGHNSRLSPLDSTGAGAFKALTAGIVLANGRKKIPAREWIRHGFSVDGPLFERWFIKTTINIAYVLKGSPTWAFDGTTGRPPLPIVEGVFGCRSVARPFGLYAAARIGEGISSSEELRCHMLYDVQGRVAGATFLFRGFNFVVNLTPVEIEGIRLQGDDGAAVRPKDELLYHLNRINADVNGFRSHYTDFIWPGSTFDHFAP